MMKIISKFCDQIWLYIVYAMGLSMAILLIMKWSDWDTPQKLVCMLAIAIPIHVFEENTYPGGFFFMNNLNFGSKQPTVYPQNRATNMVTNLGAETVFILLALNTIGMETAAITVVIFFGIVETVNHTREGISMYKRYKNKGKRTVYAPGLLTSIFPLLPMAVAGIILLNNNPFTWRDILAGIGISVGIAVFLILIPFGISIKIRSTEFSFKSIGYFKKYE